MPYIISAILVIAIVSGGGFWLRMEREQKRRYKAAVARIAALPLNERLDELLVARRERAQARLHLADVRRAFNRNFGYRRNPFFSSLLIAQSSYSAARDWVKKVEELCSEPSDSGAE
jgi:hypothetical protein